MMGYGWTGFMWPMMLVGGVVTIVFLFRSKSRTTPFGGRDDARRTTRGSALTRAEDILADRYARGEITDDKYRDRLRHLRAEPDGS